MNVNKSINEKNNYVSSLNRALHSIMQSDEKVIFMGEDILDPYGGAFKVGAGLSTGFPGRVFTTPISESAIVGIANGLALRGMKPIVEIMFGDFLTLAADQIINHSSKFTWMYNDQVELSMVIRAPMGGRRGYGPTHSQCLEKHFMGVPGLKVIAPNIISDPGSLLRRSLYDAGGPVLFIESKTCYPRNLIDNISGMVVEKYEDEETPFESACLRWDKEGDPDGLLFTYGGMTPVCLEAVKLLKEQEGLHINVILLSQLSPCPVSHIKYFLERMNSSLYVYAEEASPSGGWGAEIIANIEGPELSKANKTLQINHLRIGAKHTPIPNSRKQEEQTLPQIRDIIDGILNYF